MKFFITGVSSGVGRELARELIQAGHEVFGVARRKELLDDLKLELGPDNFHAAACDTRNPDDIARTAELMANQEFLPDVVVLNAAVDLEDVHPAYRHDRARETFETNVVGALAWVERFLEPMIRAGRGQFIAISSLFAFRPDTSSISYAASKAALAMAFRGLRLRFWHTPVRFAVVYFGPIATQINPRFSPRPSWFVLAAPRAARAVARAVRGRRAAYFIPWHAGLFMRATQWLPDRAFEWLTRPFRR